MRRGMLSVGCWMILLVLAGSLQGAQVEVSTNAVKVLPERNFARTYGTQWQATNTAVQGEVLWWGTTYHHYMAENAGTLGTNAPAHTSGIATNGTVVLRYVPRGPRSGFVVQLQSEGTVWLMTSMTNPQGFKLFGDGALWSESGSHVYQGAVWASSAEGTNQVGAIEW